jgi:hypothetical protein
MTIQNQAQAQQLAVELVSWRKAQSRAAGFETLRLVAGILAAGVALRLVLLSLGA